MAGTARATFAALAVMITWPASAQTAEDTPDALARDVDRLESLREVKDLQRSYAQYAQFGLWSDMADLFAARGRIERGDQRIEGRAAILRWLQERGGPRGLAPGALNLQLIDDPLVNLSADGGSALGRWRGLAFGGDGKGGTTIEGGLYENSYVREGGRWKIARLHYYPQYEGDYAKGWRNVGNEDLPIVPFHFTPATVGVPIPPAPGAAPATGASLQSLAARVAVLNDEDAVRNLQHAYGYYVDRKMWDDVIDLFDEAAVIEIAGVGTFRSRDGVRRAIARMGPAGLSHGELNDRPQFGTVVQIAPGGSEAFARGTELGLLGQADKGEASWEVSVFRNRFVKSGGLWKIREMRIQPLLDADYGEGWGKGGVAGSASRPLPALLGSNIATGKSVDTKGLSIVAARPLTARIAPAPAAPATSLADLRRRYMRSLAYDGTMNVSAAYGYYLDDFQWPGMSGIFALKGNKQSPFAGYYFGRDRIAGAATAMYGTTPDPTKAMRARIAFHWRIQPVIIASHDGRSATLRTRLFQMGTGKYDETAGTPNMSGFFAGMYPNDQVVLEDGVYRMWTLTIDEPYFTSAGWKGGWSAVKPPSPGSGSRPSPLLQRYPPDLPITALGKREEGFRGGTGTTIDWPGILPMWFHYRNPVSGREPPNYWPDCVPCQMLPETQMVRHGYLMPPSGPQVDGVEVPPAK